MITTNGLRIAVFPGGAPQKGAKVTSPAWTRPTFLKPLRSSAEFSKNAPSSTRTFPPAIEQALNRMARQGRQFTVVDAVNDWNLIDIGKACSKLKLITGGSGVAMGLPANFRRTGTLNVDGGLARLPKLKGAVVVLTGSCSQVTRRQINRMMKNYPGFQLDPLALSEGRQNVDTAII